MYQQDSLISAGDSMCSNVTKTYAQTAVQLAKKRVPGICFVLYNRVKEKYYSHASLTFKTQDKWRPCLHGLN